MWREQSDSELSVWTGVLALDVGSFFLLQESNILFHHKWTSHYEHHPSVYTQQLCCTEVDSLLNLPSSDSSAGETSTTCSLLPIGLAAAAASLVRAVVPDFLFSSLFRFLLRPACPPLLVPYCAKIRVCCWWTARGPSEDWRPSVHLYIVTTAQTFDGQCSMVSQADSYRIFCVLLLAPTVYLTCISQVKMVEVAKHIPALKNVR